MLKKVLVTNGLPRSGKDTFAEFVGMYIPTIKCSSVDDIKKIAKFTGWDGEKTPESRKYLAELKRLTTEFNDFPFRCMRARFNEFMIDEKASVLIFDIREPAEIERAKKEFGAEAVLIVNNRCETKHGNYADDHVMEANYDHVIFNNVSLDDFKRETYIFVRTKILSDPLAAAVISMDKSMFD